MSDEAGTRAADKHSATPSRSAESALRRTYGGESAALRATRRRTAFVEAGLQLFGTRLYSEVSVADILRESGLTRRSFYELFDDREDLLRTVEAEAVTSRVVALLTEGPPRSERDLLGALRLLDAVFDFYADDPRRAHVAFVAVVGVSRAMEEHRRKQVSRLAAAFAGAALGIIDTPVAHHAAIAFLGAFSELMIDHIWTRHNDIESVRAELHHLLRARFFTGQGVSPATCESPRD